MAVKDLDCTTTITICVKNVHSWELDKMCTSARALHILCSMYGLYAQYTDTKDMAGMQQNCVQGSRRDDGSKQFVCNKSKTDVAC